MEKEISNNPDDFFDTADMASEQLDNTKEKVYNTMKNEDFSNTEIKYEFDRLIACGIVDKCFESCVEGKCPSAELLKDAHDYLINLSVDYYCQLKVWFDGEKNIGDDHNTRQNNIENKLKSILNCEKKCDLNFQMFNQFISKIKNDPYIVSGIRNRKAYWTFLKFHPSNDPKTDYQGASAFVDKFHLNWNNLSSAELDDLFSDWWKINCFELFQRCIIKQKVQKKIKVKNKVKNKL